MNAIDNDNDNLPANYYAIGSRQGAPLMVFAGSTQEAALDAIAWDMGFRGYRGYRNYVETEGTIKPEQEMVAEEVPHHPTLRAKVAHALARVAKKGGDGIDWHEYSAICRECGVEDTASRFKFWEPVSYSSPNFEGSQRRKK